MWCCARDRSDGTWILPEMVQAYTVLHRLGHAHSLEVWRGEDLVGGVYGVHRGGLFAAESMFHLEDNASKFALISAVNTLRDCGVELIDVQLKTGHLESLGVVEIPRREYLAEVARLRGKPVQLTP
jgi:leucyl/phenylalanyl-tRNA--protein transferase